MKRKLILVLAALMLLASAVLICYPVLSNIYLERKKAEVLTSYDEVVENTTSLELTRMWEKAKEYNKAFVPGITQYSAEKLGELTKGYKDMLNIDNDGIMGYVKIPKLDIAIPIYHGTSSSTLEQGCGHLLGSSLPVGGASTHCILTAHSGLASQKMFSDIDLLENEDIIDIYVLDKKLTYKVCQKQVVLPEETQSIEIKEGQDLVSLITCTPFGVNTHRLIVTGTRVEEDNLLSAEDKNITKSISSTSIWEQEYLKGITLGLVALCVISTVILLPIRLKRIKRKPS